MEQVLFDDLLQSLNEAVSYANGDKTQGRSVSVITSYDEGEIDKMIYEQLVRLSTENKVKVIKYANDLQQTSF